MDAVNRLVTYVELDPRMGRYGDPPRQLSVAVLHELELATGRRVLLLDDRGWTASGPADIWSHTTMESVIATARMVVGPDEPAPGCSLEQAAADHWAYLSARAREQAVDVEAQVLAALPHDVEVSAALRQRLDRVGD